MGYFTILSDLRLVWKCYKSCLNNSVFVQLITKTKNYVCAIVVLRDLREIVSAAKTSVSIQKAQFGLLGGSVVKTKIQIIKLWILSNV